MKNLKLSFAAIIAFVALGFTVAAQAGAFETKVVRAVDCFRPTTQLKATCPSATTTVQIGNVCNLAWDDDHIYALSSNVIDPAIDCSGSGFICCFQIEADLDPCEGQPSFDPAGPLPLGQYKVANVVCKSTAN